MSQKRSLFLTNSTTAEMEVTKKGKKGPGLKIVCAQPEPVPTVPSNLDKSTTISINGKKLNIAADDLQFVCSLGEFECSSSLWDTACVACSYLPKPCWCFCVSVLGYHMCWKHIIYKLLKKFAQSTKNI